MSFSELVNELKLENSVIAITRVKWAYEEPKPERTFGCIYKTLREIRNGRTLVTTADFCRCPGFTSNSGLRDELPKMPGGLGYFLSKGCYIIGAPPGERFKCDPEMAMGMWDHLPKDVMGGYDAIKMEPYREGMKCDVVVAFCNPDQLSAMIVLHGYDKPEHDRVIATTASGCASMFRMAFGELKNDKPRAILTGTDLAQREYMDENELAISIVGSDFEKMLAVTDECFFHSPVWKPVRKRLHREEAK